MAETYFIGWLLTATERARLLSLYPSRYIRVIADHVTQWGHAADGAPPPETSGEIIGEADDGQGVQALVVRIGGSPARPDGKVYHLTWSLAEGRRAVESNDVIARSGWRGLDPRPVRLAPVKRPVS